ncbi:MAG: hypothetical protein ABI675_26805 [Chitinophagaceae bacterium]
MQTTASMNNSPLNVKQKSILHSFGVVFILLMFFLLSLSVVKTPIAWYLIAGLLTGEIGRIIFSKRKYLISIQQDDLNVTIRYLNRVLLQKNISINKEDLNIYDVTETNWWSGNLDLVNFSNGKKDLTFVYIDRKLKQSIPETLKKE